MIKCWSQQLEQEKKIYLSASTFQQRRRLRLRTNLCYYTSSVAFLTVSAIFSLSLCDGIRTYGNPSLIRFLFQTFQLAFFVLLAPMTAQILQDKPQLPHSTHVLWNSESPTFNWLVSDQSKPIVCMIIFIKSSLIGWNKVISARYLILWSIHIKPYKIWRIR